MPLKQCNLFPCASLHKDRVFYLCACWQYDRLKLGNHRPEFPRWLLWHQSLQLPSSAHRVTNCCILCCDDAFLQVWLRKSRCQLCHAFARSSLFCRHCSWQCYPLKTMHWVRCMTSKSAFPRGLVLPIICQYPLVTTPHSTHGLYDLPRLELVPGVPYAEKPVASCVR